MSLLVDYNRYAHRNLPTMRGFGMMMVMLECSDTQVAHVGRYSMTEEEECQEDDCDFDDVVL